MIRPEARRRRELQARAIRAGAAQAAGSPPYNKKKGRVGNHPDAFRLRPAGLPAPGYLK